MASSLPYFHLDSWDIPLGFAELPIQPFGVLVATGVLVGAHLVRKRGDRINANDEHLRRLIGWVLVGGFLGAHLFDVLMYQRDKLADDPLLLVKLWAGISSYGGFIGGFFAGVYYMHRNGLPLGAYGDTIAWGLLPGFTIGRLGCTIVSDHPGAPTDFVLGVDYPARFIANHPQLYEGQAVPMRLHNLGLYEFLYLVPLCAILYLLTRRPRPHGFIMAAIAIGYAPVRFFLEFLRLSDTDPRYLGLTFAQWVSIATVAAGTVALVKIYQRTADNPDARGAALPDIPDPGKKTVSKTRAAEARASKAASPPRAVASKGKAQGSKKKRKK